MVILGHSKEHIKMDEKDTQNQEAKKVTESAEDVRRPVQNRVVPPDGGWGWVVMIVIIFVHFILLLKKINKPKFVMVKQKLFNYLKLEKKNF